MQRALKIEVECGQLLVVQLLAPMTVRARSGRHWLTVDGLDVCLAAGELDTLPAGKLVLEGDGTLEFAAAAETPGRRAACKAPAQRLILAK